MKNLFQYIWTSETNTYMPDRSYNTIIDRQYKALLDIFDSESDPATAVVLGTRGKGKTVFFKKSNVGLGIRSFTAEPVSVCFLLLCLLT